MRAAVAAGEGAFSTLMTRSVSSMIQSSMMSPCARYGLGSHAGRRPFELFVFDFGNQSLEGADEGWSAEAAPHFFEAHPPMFRGHSPRADVSCPFGNIAEIDRRVAVAFASEREHGVGATFKAAMHDFGEVNAEEWEVRIADRIDESADKAVGLWLERVEFAAERQDESRGLHAA